MNKFYKISFTIMLIAFFSVTSGCSSPDQYNVELKNVADQLERDIVNMVKRASLSLDSIVAEGQLIAQLQEKDKDVLQDFANKRLKIYGGAFDLMAIYDADGQILTMNSETKTGEAIDPKKISSILDIDFTDREVVKTCLIDKKTKKSVQFQTHCDFTPLLYESSGLSVALTAPVIADTGKKVGAISIRLNFNRITYLLNSQYYQKYKDKIFLVSDEGEYYSEAISKNQKEAPIPSIEIKKFLSNESVAYQGLFIKEQNLFAKKVIVDDVIKGGNIYILVFN